MLKIKIGFHHTENRLDNEALSEQAFINKRYQMILHISSDSSNQMQPLTP